MAEINSEAVCGGCPFYRHMEDADVLEDNPARPISSPWGHCQRFPHWERKSPTTRACGEHPQYFEKEYSGGWGEGTLVELDGPIS